MIETAIFLFLGVALGNFTYAFLTHRDWVRASRLTIYEAFVMILIVIAVLTVAPTERDSSAAPQNVLVATGGIDGHPVGGLKVIATSTAPTSTKKVVPPKTTQLQPTPTTKDLLRSLGLATNSRSRSYGYCTPNGWEEGMYSATLYSSGHEVMTLPICDPNIKGAPCVERAYIKTHPACHWDEIDL